METENAKSYFGALALAVAGTVADAWSAHSSHGPCAGAMLCLSYEAGISIGVLAARIGLSHAGAVRLIDRLEKELLVERRTEESDKRARFIHLTGAGEQMVRGLLKVREEVISNCVSDLSPDELSTLGMLSERLLRANGSEVGFRSFKLHPNGLFPSRTPQLRSRRQSLA